MSQVRGVMLFGYYLSPSHVYKAEAQVTGRALFVLSTSAHLRPLVLRLVSYILFVLSTSAHLRPLVLSPPQEVMRPCASL
jgi:hypothetical protein